MSTSPGAGFVERFGSLLEEAGIPRMPARVLAALITTDEGALTSAELAGQLDVSAAAISGAVRYLTQVNLVVRERERGSRRERYVLRDDPWYEAAAQRDVMLARWVEHMRVGAGSYGADTPTGLRLAETGAFYEFMLSEMPTLLGRWREQKDERIAAFAEDADAGSTSPPA